MHELYRIFKLYNDLNDIIEEDPEESDITIDLDKKELLKVLNNFQIMKKKDTILFELVLQEETIEDITDNLFKEIELLKKEVSFYHSFFGFDMTEIWKFYDKMKKDRDIIYFKGWNNSTQIKFIGNIYFLYFTLNINRIIS